MSKHTKGPWRFGYFISGWQAIGRINEHESWHLIANVRASDIHALSEDSEAEANAYLIAAAPEMLEALEWVETQLVIKNVNAPDTLKRVQEAIKKARGEK